MSNEIKSTKQKWLEMRFIWRVGIKNRDTWGKKSPNDGKKPLLRSQWAWQRFLVMHEFQKSCVDLLQSGNICATGATWGCLEISG